MNPSAPTIEKLTGKFGASLAYEQAGGLTAVIVGKDLLREVLLFLKTEEGLLYTMMTDLFAVDRYGSEPRFEVVYLLNSLAMKERLVVKVRVAEGETVPTVSDLFRAADWLEREAYDMFGLGFENHPDLRRILTVEDFDGYPLRKDFPTEGYGFETPFRVRLEDAEATPQKADR